MEYIAILSISCRLRISVVDWWGNIYNLLQLGSNQCIAVIIDYWGWIKLKHKPRSRFSVAFIVDAIRFTNKVSCIRPLTAPEEIVFISSYMISKDSHSCVLSFLVVPFQGLAQLSRCERCGCIWYVTHFFWPVKPNHFVSVQRMQCLFQAK